MKYEITSLINVIGTSLVWRISALTKKA